MSQPHKIDILVGKNLRMLRSVQGLTQAQLAKQIGITFQQIQKNEKGQNRIGASRLYELSKVLNVNIAAFYKGLDTESFSLEAFDKDTNKLIRDYSRIKDPNGRKAVKQLITILGRGANGK